MTQELQAEWERIKELEKIDKALAIKLAQSWAVSLAEHDMQQAERAAA